MLPFSFRHFSRAGLFVNKLIIYSNSLVIYFKQELKKLAKPNGKTDAATLTDEELCASVDKDTGYIRFTLKKRRGVAPAAAGHDERAESCAAKRTEERQLPADRTLSMEEDDRQVLSVKRTKMNDENEVGKENEEASNTRSEKCETSPDEVCQQAREAARVSEPQALKARKASADSIQMDASQVSTSSSDMSIKSIVSLKNQPNNESNKDDAQQAKTAHLSTASNLVDCKLDRRPAEKPDDKPTDGTTRDGETTPKNEVHQVATAPRVVSKSIVNETARRLEAAAAAAAASSNPSSLKKPIAATRRNLQANQMARPISMDSACGGSEAEDKENTSARPIVLAKKPICWPPKPSTNGNVDGAENGGQPLVGPTVGRVTANRLSFQKLIEESSSQVSQAGRAKPSPPVKPASLIANRFKAQT